MSRLLSFPEQVLRPAVAGTVTAIWTVVASIAYATLVFSGPLAPALAIGLYMAPKVALDRLSTTHSEIANGTLNERRVIWQAGLQVCHRCLQQVDYCKQ